MTYNVTEVVWQRVHQASCKKGASENLKKQLPSWKVAVSTKNVQIYPTMSFLFKSILIPFKLLDITFHQNQTFTHVYLTVVSSAL